VPPESTTFSITPTVYWNAIDVDGYITKYQYAVIIGSSVSNVDSTCNALKGIPPSIWVDSLQSIDPDVKFISAKETESSIVKVQLFAAGQSEADTIRQYLFVRAVDDDNAVSNVIHRMFSRNNHRPKAHINYAPFYTYNASGVVTSMTIYYSLPETTYTWRGIKIAWEGSDSQDYKVAQPNFLYKWELYGPLAETVAIDQVDTTALKADGRLVDVSFNESDSTTPFVEDKSILLPMNGKCLVNCPHRVVVPYTPPQPPDSGYGWYLFVVWTMDDAFALSNSLDSVSNPKGHLWFRTIHPQFSYQNVKKVAIIDRSAYGQNYAGTKFEDSTRAFYDRAFSSLVNHQPPICDSFVFVDTGKVNSYLSKDTLSRYNLVVYLNESKPNDCSNLQSPLTEYLGVGGKVWAIGNGEATFGGGTNVGWVDFTVTPSSPYCIFAINYFQVLGMYSANWNSFAPYQDLEFIGAKACDILVPDLKVDSTKVYNQILWGSGNKLDTVVGNLGRLPHASFQALGYTRRIYTYVSATPDNSVFHNNPCGSLYEGPTFKTAYMSFALHFMQEVDTTTTPNYVTRDTLFKRIVEWFWED
jgi:hypothetical protein